MIMDQQTYSIGEVGRMLDVEPHTLRYWEKEFKDFIKPRRVSRKNRVYGETDIAVLRNIKELLTVELFTIAGARRQMYLRTASGF
jgi:DNA-binding transcriptional MerR regulator